MMTGRPHHPQRGSRVFDKTSLVEGVLNALGLVLCLGGVGLLLFRNRVVSREAELENGKAQLEQYFLGRYWLDLGVASLVVGFIFQIIAAIL